MRLRERCRKAINFGDTCQTFIYHNLFTTMFLKFRKFMRFLRFECRCTISRQAWENKDTKFMFLSLHNDVRIKYQEYIFKAYTTIIFGVTVVNADRKIVKIKGGAQIIARRW